MEELELTEEQVEQKVKYYKWILFHDNTEKELELGN